MPKRQRFLLTVALLLAGGILIGTVHHSRKHLLRRAAPIPLTRGVVTSDEVSSGYLWGKLHRSASCVWLEDGGLITFVSLTASRYEVTRWDARTGRQTRVNHLERFMNDTNGPGTLFSWQASPNGRWLLFTRADDRRVIHAAARTDEDTWLSWTNRFWNSLSFWLSDSRGFVEWRVRERGGAGRLYRVEPHQAATVEVNLPAEPSAPGPLIGDHGRAVLPLVHGTHAQGQIIQVQFTATDPVLTTSALDFPKDFGAIDWICQVGPTGDRLAWLVFFQERWPHLRWERSFPFVQTETRFVASLWVSGLDGSRLREVGHLPPSEDIRRISWTPDGHHLSFVCRDALWKVTAD